MGEEFQFFLHDESYWISQNSNGFYLTRETDSFSQSFNTADELFQNGKIDGKPIIELWDKVEL